MACLRSNALTADNTHFTFHTLFRAPSLCYAAGGILNTSKHISFKPFDRLGPALLLANLLKALPQYEACVDATLAEDAFSTLKRQGS